MQDIELTGSREVLDELQSGRTRELLLLLQDKPVPEVQDPMNIQSGLSSDEDTTVNDDYQIKLYQPNYTWENGTHGFNDTTREQTSVLGGDYVGEITASDGEDITATREFTSPTQSDIEVSVYWDTAGSSEFDYKEIQIYASRSDSTANNKVLRVEHHADTNDVTTYDYDTGGDVTIGSWQPQTAYTYKFVFDYSNRTADIIRNGVTLAQNISMASSDNTLNETAEVGINLRGYSGFQRAYIDDVRAETGNLDAYVTDQFAAPTTEPTDFQQWNAIQARDVTTGGSTSADPVEFEILDSTDTVLNSTRIPKARIADEPFTMRNRVYSESAGSDGQSDYQIATTGDGGHFGIPILTVVSVKKNGSVLDSANWSFDGTDTVTIDTSNVTIASGDTIDIKYDFDVFDSTLQPRAYLNRESRDETSPSISHFKYEYVI